MAVGVGAPRSRGTARDRLHGGSPPLLFKIGAQLLIFYFPDALYLSKVIGAPEGARGNDSRQDGSDAGDVLERFGRGGVDVQFGAGR